MSDTLNPNPSPSIPSNEQPKTLEQIMREKAPDVLDAIPLTKQPRLAKITVGVRSGPLPDPDALAEYSRIIPDGADRIMKMAENQSAHRIALEKMVVESQRTQAFCGQIFGLIIGLAGLGLATYAAVHGQPWFGSVIGSTTLVSLVSAFLYSQRKQKTELAAKRQQSQQLQQGPKQKEKRK